MALKLDKKDLAILDILERDSRMPISKIAKKMRLSKDGVNYRFKKLIENRVITRFFIDIDIAKLGLQLNKITIQFKNTTKEKQEEIFNYMKSHPKIGWVVFCSGRWDCIIVSYVKDLYEYELLLDDLMQKYGQYILAKEFAALPRYYVCSRKWLTQGKQPKISHIGGKPEDADVDINDIKIIKLLAENSRMPILDISLKTKMSSSLIIQRIKKLERKGVILNYRIGLNLKILEKEFCKSFIYLENTSNEQKNKLVKYCLNHNNVTAVTHSIGPWDLELEMEVKNLEEFYDIMNDLKTRFNTIIRNYEAVTITKEYGIDYNSILS